MRQRRKDYRKLINSTRWQRVRAEVLARRPLCADCGERGVVRPAREVHHIIPLESVTDAVRMASLAYDPLNLVGLCRECHRRRHAELGKGGAAAAKARNREEAEAFCRRMLGVGTEEGGPGF